MVEERHQIAVLPAFQVLNTSMTVVMGNMNAFLSIACHPSCSNFHSGGDTAEAARRRSAVTTDKFIGGKLVP
jgi:hypothetical protein